jgi:hypothetical protein
MTSDPRDTSREPDDAASSDDANPERAAPDVDDDDRGDEVDEVDEAGIESFPASDPPAWNARA